MTERYIEVAVPESAAGKDSIAVLVDDLGQRTEAVTLQLTATNPAVFVKDFLGRGLADTLESESGTVTLQLTGAGDLRLPVEARIAGHPAEVLSVEAVAGQAGRFAVKLRVPPEALAQDAESGTVSVQIGEAVTQPGVLVRLK